MALINSVPCLNCGATDWTVTMITDCDKCNPDLSLERFHKQMECPHKNQEESRIIGMMKCLDCGLLGSFD